MSLPHHTALGSLCRISMVASSRRSFAKCAETVGKYNAPPVAHTIFVLQVLPQI
jgi:hypothetical protein